MVTANQSPSLTMKSTIASTSIPSLRLQQQPEALAQMPPKTTAPSEAVDKSFMILFYHGGAFETTPLKYVGGTSKCEYNVQCKSLSYSMLVDLVASLGYKNVLKIHYKHPDSSLFEGLRILIGDRDIPRMLEIMHSAHWVEIYLEHEDGGNTNEEGDLEEECDYSDEELSGDSEGDSDDELCAARIKVKQHKEKMRKVMNQVEGKVVSNGNAEGDLEHNKKGPLESEASEESDESEEEGNDIRVAEVNNDRFGIRIESRIENTKENSGYVSDYIDSDDECDSPSEYEQGDGLVRKKVVYPTFNPKSSFFNIDPSLGMKFAAMADLKKLMKCFAMRTSKAFKFTRNTKKELEVKCCKEGCPFRLWASYMQKEKTIQIKSFQTKHKNCLRTCRIKICNSTFLSWLYNDRIHANPRWKLREIKEDAFRFYKLEVSLAQCYRAKHKALADVEKSLKEHYKKIWNYAAEYNRADPNGTYLVKVHRLVQNGPPVFLRFYVCMDVVKKSWIQGCRPIIGLDGCFLRGFCKGELLIAIGRDGNNQIFPIAWAQVEVENTSSWTWFVEILASDLGYSQGHGLSIISDQQKGLMEAVHQVLPLAEHRNCARHIYANFRKSFPGAQWKSYFWAAAKCVTQ